MTRKPAAAKKTKQKRPRSPKWVPPAHWRITPDEWFATRAAPHRPITDALRKLIDDAVPGGTWALRFGFPTLWLDGGMVTSVDIDRRRVNVIFTGPPGSFDALDPDHRLHGDGLRTRYLPLTSVDQIPRARLRAWLRKAAELAPHREKRTAAYTRAMRALLPGLLLALSACVVSAPPPSSPAPEPEVRDHRATSAGEICPPGESCNLDCAQGGCSIACEQGATCNVDCSGGGCSIDCGPGAACNLDCSAGGCTTSCAAGASCNIDCSSGGCSNACDEASSCNVDCSAGGCT